MEHFLMMLLDHLFVHRRSSTVKHIILDHRKFSNPSFASFLSQEAIFMFVGTILFLAIGSLAVESYTYRTEGYIRDTGLVSSINWWNRDHCILGQTFNILSPPQFWCICQQRIFSAFYRQFKFHIFWWIACFMSNYFCQCYKKHLKLEDGEWRHFIQLYSAPLCLYIHFIIYIIFLGLKYK